MESSRDPGRKGGQIDWVCAGRLRLRGSSELSRMLASLTRLFERWTPRVRMQQWVRYRIDLDRAPPPPSDVELTPLSETVIAELQHHPDAPQPDFASALTFWSKGLRNGFLWTEDGEPLCTQWLLTRDDDPALRRLAQWGAMYPPLDPGSGQVEKLWTFSTARRKGVATLFEFALFARARALGLRRLFTHIGEGNTAARRWADKTGWEEFGTIERFSFDLPGIRNLNSPVCVHWATAAG